MSNAEARAYWSEQGGPRWVRQRDHHDAVLAPLLEALLDAADPHPGELVLDIGCGSGTSTITAAEAVAPDGRVVGIDFSPVLLDDLRRRLDDLRAGGRELPVDVLLADAQTDLLPGPADLVISRFGVMFFDDPTSAWRNLREATGDEGRLAFVCWQAPELNTWVSVPGAAAVAVAPDTVMPPADAPGPFGLADADRTAAMLTAAGWRDVSVADDRRRLLLGRTVDDAVDHVSALGAVGRAIVSAGEDVVLPAVRAALAPHADDDGSVRMDAAAWLVTARR